MLKKATIRKEQEPDFEEKRFNVTIGEDEREFDKENDFFRERSYRIIREYDLLPLNTLCHQLKLGQFYHIVALPRLYSSQVAKATAWTNI